MSDAVKIQFALVSHTNNGKTTHNLTILSGNSEVGKSKNLNKGESDTFTVTLAAGSYKTDCSIPGHAQQGMVGTLTLK